MPGVDPCAQLNQLDDRSRAKTVLDELEYLYEVLDPELQYLADDLIARVRRRRAES
ncbi:MAG: hypothetical protein PVF91_07170 [Chromatiales bacterium]|jgi:hypothetical protein